MKLLDPGGIFLNPVILHSITFMLFHIEILITSSLLLMKMDGMDLCPSVRNFGYEDVENIVIEILQSHDFQK